jgi:hypothetical protein
VPVLGDCRRIEMYFPRLHGPRNRGESFRVRQPERRRGWNFRPEYGEQCRRSDPPFWGRFSGNCGGWAKAAMEPSRAMVCGRLKREPGAR